MSLFNFATKELTLKIVYYGPGLGGKTTNLQYLHSILNPQSRGKLLSLATEVDRTLFFDFLPVSLGKVKGFAVKIQLYTVPGQVYYNATRKLVLRGADAVVFVANSQSSMRKENIESLKNMWDNLKANNLNVDEIPIIIQYNKRDLPDIDTVDELNKYLNTKNYPVAQAIAIKGEGVEETFQAITRQLVKSINKQHKLERNSAQSLTSNNILGDIKKTKKTGSPALSKKDDKKCISSKSEKKNSAPEHPAQVIELSSQEQKIKDNQLSLPDSVSCQKKASLPILNLENTEALTEKIKIFSQKLATIDSAIETISTKLKQSHDEHKKLSIMLDEINSLLYNEHSE